MLSQIKLIGRPQFRSDTQLHAWFDTACVGAEDILVIPEDDDPGDGITIFIGGNGPEGFARGYHMNEVIEKAAIAIDGVMVTGDMPENNADWHEMGWDEIHAMANEAAQAEGRPVDV